MATKDFGEYYWCIKVPKTVSALGQIYAYADEVVLTASGALQFKQDTRIGKITNLVISPGSWLIKGLSSLNSSFQPDSFLRLVSTSRTLFLA